MGIIYKFKLRQSGGGNGLQPQLP